MALRFSHFGIQFHGKSAYARSSAYRIRRFARPRGVSQAGVARLTARQVNNWCRGRAAVPPWAVALAVLLEQHSQEAIAMRMEGTDFVWYETLGVPPNACADAVGLAMRRFAIRYHLERGGTEPQTARIEAAYDVLEPPLCGPGE
jgi:hypothetical protein